MDTNLNFSQPIPTEEQRKSPRISFRESVSFHQMKDPRRFGGCLSLDLSEGGIRVYFDQFLPIGSLLNVQLQLGDKHIVDLTGRVAWVVQVPHSERYQLGLEFIEPGPVADARSQLRNYFQSRRF